MVDEFANLYSPKSLSEEKNDSPIPETKVNPQIKFSIVEKWKETMN